MRHKSKCETQCTRQRTLMHLATNVTATPLTRHVLAIDEAQAIVLARLHEHERRLARGNRRQHGRAGRAEIIVLILHVLIVGGRVRVHHDRRGRIRQARAQAHNRVGIIEAARVGIKQAVAGGHKDRAVLGVRHRRTARPDASAVAIVDTAVGLLERKGLRREKEEEKFRSCTQRTEVVKEQRTAYTTWST